MCGFCPLSVLWTCCRAALLTGPWISLGAYDSLHRPRLCAGSPPSSLGQEGWLLSLVSVGAGGRCCLAGAGRSGPHPVLGSGMDAGSASGRRAGKELACPPALPGPVSISVVLVCAGLFASVA